MGPISLKFANHMPNFAARAGVRYSRTQPASKFTSLKVNRKSEAVVSVINTALHTLGSHKVFLRCAKITYNYKKKSFDEFIS